MNHSLKHLCIAIPFIMTGCAPTIHLDSPEPIKVDITMKVDVYQRKDEAAAAEKKLNEDDSKAFRRRDERAEEIWMMKNDEVLIEGTKGYLEFHSRSGWDSEYVQKVMTDENKDRRLLYESQARESARPVETIELEVGTRLRQQTYGHAKPNDPASK